MKGMAFLLIGWAFLSNIQAQTITFSKIFSNYPLDPENAWNVVEIPDGYILVSWGECLGQDVEICCVISRLNKTGDIIWFKQYDFYPTKNSMVIKDNKMYVSGGDDGQFALYCMDMDGNVIWHQEYGDPTEDEGSPALLLTSDNQFILCGARSRIALGTGRWLVYHVKTDMDGNLIDEHTYGEQEYATLSRKIIESTSGETLFSYAYYPGMSFFEFKAGVTSVDEAGSINWVADFPLSLYPDECYVIQTDSQTLVTEWKVDSTSPVLAVTQPVLFYMNLSGQPLGKLAWWNFPVKDMNDIAPVWNKGLVGCGSDHYVDILEGTTGWVFRVNEQREILWERSYTDTTSQGWPFGLTQIKPTADGGFIAVGTMNNTMTGVLESHNWILKLDSMGCLQPDCWELNFITTSTEMVFLKGKDIQIYPNPGDGHINIQFPSEFDNLKNLVINVVSNDGKLIRRSNRSQSDSETSMDLTAAPAGVYYVIVSQLNEVIASRKIVIVK